jgi:hypothetical protein
MKDQETYLAGVHKFPVILEWLKNYRLNPEGRREEDPFWESTNIML